MQATLEAFAQIERPGTIVDLPFSWSADDAWKDRVMRPQSNNDSPAGAAAEHEDDRVERYDTPQYQHAADAEAASEDCPSCIFLTEA